ncbi:hypothetical protein DM01DRAFT_290212 [Hesseltinella vesiculosa]|uniref:Fe2OG dioxygenase domain-containing protein n=1 Tax=Hesseltinella vesiculosa TaxID=101127 RepID=A0A1X2GFP0_9FUNG|nr:hypothetical protein DM01DRAFT_290212 [Hesseltinella vesiculosa]
MKAIGTSVPGLVLYEDFVTKQEEAALIQAVNEQDWSGIGIGPNPELKRRTQQYGHLFSYRFRKVLEEYGPLPSFVDDLVVRIMNHQLMPHRPNHLLVNEYNQGQGIMPHTDAPALFGPSILSLSLLTPCLMKFIHVETKEETDIYLPARSLITMTGDARYLYKHGISKDLEEVAPDGTHFERGKRISFTFREIIAWEVPSDQACGCQKS